MVGVILLGFSFYMRDKFECSSILLHVNLLDT